MRMTNQPCGRRAGFTAVELLIVVSIIAILVALSASAVMRFATTGQVIATQRNLDKILASLNAQYRAVTNQAQSESMSAPANQAFLQQAVQNVQKQVYGSSPATSSLATSDPRVRQEYVRLKVVQAFPTSFMEALMPSGNPKLAWKGYQNYLGALGVTVLNANSVTVADPRGSPPVPSSNSPWEGQMGVCVLMILQKGPSNQGLTADDLGTGAVGQMTLTVPGPPVATPTAQAVVDAWGRGVLFTRRYYNPPTYTNEAPPTAGTYIPYPDRDLALLSAGRNGLSGLELLPAVPADYLQGVMFTDFYSMTSPAAADDNILSFNQPGS